MTMRTRATRTAAIAAFVLAVGLAGCSTVPSTEPTASGGVACLGLRSTVTNLNALRAWCLDHDDPAGAAGWLSGIEAALTGMSPGKGATATRVHDAATELDAQVKQLRGNDGEAAMAALPGVLAKVAGTLEPARDAVCS